MPQIDGFQSGLSCLTVLSMPLVTGVEASSWLVVRRPGSPNGRAEKPVLSDAERAEANHRLEEGEVLL